jgi:hypothetical protein
MMSAVSPSVLHMFFLERIQLAGSLSSSSRGWDRCAILSGCVQREFLGDLKLHSSCNAAFLNQHHLVEGQLTGQEE